jgi:hypothetical protein
VEIKKIIIIKREKNISAKAEAVEIIVKKEA